ncbi:MAG: hypothetical protein LQ348_007780 [Seirophora lacunosa]|nr:MAG: hypothetical protein LQ348_007780 [Seirophora lacunosa]
MLLSSLAQFSLLIYSASHLVPNVLAAPPHFHALNPSTPPPEPWDEETCSIPALYPDLYLTFTWGTTISRSALAAALHSSIRTLRLIIRDGHAARHLAPHIGSFLVPYRGLVLVARPYGEAVFTYRQICEAVELLQRCGPGRGYRDEMWAYVYGKGERVGDISIQMGRRPDDDDDDDAMRADVATA